VLGVCAGGLVLGYLFTWAVFFPGLGRDAIVTVPDLRTRPLAAATRLAENAGLKLVRGNTLPNPSVPAGAVLAQVPMPGQEATRGASVRVILSSGPERHPVPELKGLGWRDAVALLQAYGFTVRVAQVTSPEPEGRILRVFPEPGTTIAVNQVIQVTVSAGPPWTVAPGVTGAALGAAETALTAAGLRLGKVSYDSASAAAPGSVVSQYPAAGDSIRQGGAVSVMVAGTDPNPPPPAAVDSAAAPAAEGEPARPGEPAPATPPSAPEKPAAPAAPHRGGRR
jgi:serine/threonine-protein kinase